VNRRRHTSSPKIALPADIELWCERVRRSSVTVVLDLDAISCESATALDPELSSALIALARAGVDSILISRHALDRVHANRRFVVFGEALDAIRARDPNAYVIAIGAANEAAAASLHDSELGIELCARRRERRLDREAVRDFLWWVIEARYTWPAWAPPVESLVGM
jgi:hypothetical protein